jgi:hypothetical protein
MAQVLAYDAAPSAPENVSYKKNAQKENSQDKIRQNKNF